MSQNSPEYEEERNTNDGNCRERVRRCARSSTRTPINEIGAKDIGEAATVGSTPAIANAVVDALKPFGINHIDIPLTPQKVWSAIQAKR